MLKRFTRKGVKKPPLFVRGHLNNKAEREREMSMLGKLLIAVGSLLLLHAGYYSVQCTCICLLSVAVGSHCVCVLN